MPDDVDDYSDATFSENEDESEISNNQEDTMTEHNNIEGDGEVKKKKYDSKYWRRKAKGLCSACYQAHLVYSKSYPTDLFLHLPYVKIGLGCKR
jgi:hypothetical protein